MELRSSRQFLSSALVLFLAAPLGISQSASGASVSVQRSKLSQRPLSEIIEGLRDYDNICEQGCKYSVKGLRQSKLVSSEGEVDVVWQELRTLIPVKHFVVYRESAGPNGGIYLDSGYPDSELLKELQASSSFPHQTSFQNFRVSWELQPDASGSTLVRSTMTVDHSFPTNINKIIENELLATVESALDEL